MAEANCGRVVQKVNVLCSFDIISVPDELCVKIYFNFTIT